MNYANDDVESLKLQLAMMKEREEKKDASKGTFAYSPKDINLRFIKEV